MARWERIRNGQAIAWNVAEGDLHTDDVEMAGFGCAQIVTYGMTEDGFLLEHHPVFPTLRTRPNNTHASYQITVPFDRLPRLLADGKPVKERLIRVEFDGILALFTRENGLEMAHFCFPSAEKRLCFEKITVKNTGKTPVFLEISRQKTCLGREMGPMGINLIEYFTDFSPKKLAPGQQCSYTITICGRMAHEPQPMEDAAAAMEARYRAVERLTAPMVLETGNGALDTMFRFAKLRAGESVFDTRFGCGRIHCPGGRTYYAATWCNDQVEYAGSYFAYTGDPVLLDASMNAYRMYMPFMDGEYQPIPSSVIAEGLDYWNGAGDRGDAAMYLYGASRFALTCGDRKTAEGLLPAMEWCAEYCRGKTTPDGVIASDSDELEGRFSAGKENLCTSALAYDGLRSLAALERDFGAADKAEAYEVRAESLARAMEAYFGAELHGFETYRYFAGCEKLRSWICMPLCVGLFDRAADTVAALCSEYLRKPDGFLTEEGSITIWDRSTLYALRGIFAAGDGETAMELLERYVHNRLLGERVPYAVEAYPEGGRRQLSGESALLCKVVLEGLLCMTPTGLRSFTVKPTLPARLDHLYLRNIHAHGTVFDVLVERDGFRVSRGGETIGGGKCGECAAITV